MLLFLVLSQKKIRTDFPQSSSSISIHVAAVVMTVLVTLLVIVLVTVVKPVTRFVDATVFMWQGVDVVQSLIAT
jgi:hypothetical protein